SAAPTEGESIHSLRPAPSRAPGSRLGAGSIERARATAAHAAAPPRLSAAPGPRARGPPCACPPFPGPAPAGLQVLAGAVLAALSRAGHAHLLCRSLLPGALLCPGRKCAAHLHQLVLRRHLLGHQRRLD